MIRIRLGYSICLALAASWFVVSYSRIAKMRYCCAHPDASGVFTVGCDLLLSYSKWCWLIPCIGTLVGLYALSKDKRKLLEFTISIVKLLSLVLVFSSILFWLAQDIPMFSPYGWKW